MQDLSIIEDNLKKAQESLIKAKNETEYLKAQADVVRYEQMLATANN